MYELIAEKGRKLASYRSSNPELAKWLKKSDLWHWIYSLRLVSGMPVSKKNIADVLDGKIVGNVPMGFYDFSFGCCDMQSDIENNVEMGNMPDIRLLKRWFSFIEKRPLELRRNNPVIYELDHIPPHFSSVETELNALLKRIFRESSDADPIERAALMQLEMFRLYPFGEDTLTVSMLLMFYIFIKEKLPFPELSSDDREFNTMVASCIKTSDGADLVDFWKRCTLNRVEAALNICYQLPQQEDQ